MTYDEPALGQLLEASQDLHSDAMRTARAPFVELVELGHERRARGAPDPEEQGAFDDGRRRALRQCLTTGALATAGFGAALVALWDTPAFAQAAGDVQILQTAASLENLAVATYGTALALPFIGGSPANAVIKAFVMTTKDQHLQHANAFNAAAQRLGGKAQPNADPVLLGVVTKAKPTLTSPAAVIDLAIQLETGAAETYVANTSALTDKNARAVTASIMGVEAQHVAVLNSVKGVLATGHPELVALPPDIAKLPAAAGSIGFPDAFLKTDKARPNNEGVVK